MIHPHTELRFISAEVGYGVVATSFIPKGTITWVQDRLDREFSPKDFQSLDFIYQEILDTYTFRNNKGNHILCWDHGRFVNHSFSSNCLTTSYDFEIAIRDIYPGEELTDDYGYLNISRPFQPRDEGSKRTMVYPDDLLRYYKIWDRQLEEVFGKIPLREQPLRNLLSQKTWKKIIAISNGEEKMDSILNCYYQHQFT